MELSRRTALGAAALAGAAAALPAATAAAQPYDLALPSTPMATAARRLIETELAAPVRNHSIRGYLFGRAIADAHGLRPGGDFDDELMYLICALHDIGLGEIANGHQRFEVDGADYAAEFLERNGMTDARVDTVWDAIAAHTSGFSDSPVYRRRRPAEIWIAVDGIGIDIGGGPADLPPGYADQVHARYPRLGGTRALTEVIEAQALADPRKAVPGTLPGEIVHQRHPELPYPTWDEIINSGGWGD
ncbi:HD domain-containing protein [Nocardia cyriacigeorgica]|uniref:HD domain-containing protein n=1 Tax=Nocardia cyriacigeorgica TaxID=135487 RepID=UPI001894441E|nr:HD domain-containing protein [Nocardia cyriacigeorgica]MBF6159897.1 HD domain-containing protein [Nocardia cyriacigeorgica]MBF6198981.1 HD domain-containing protein [Nocardia cyriacigeorgica]